MPVYKPDRSDYWYADVTVGGRRHRFSTKRKRRKEAEAVADEFERKELDKLQLGAKEEVSLYGAVLRYLKTLKGYTREDLTRQAAKTFGRSQWATRGVHTLPVTLMLPDFRQRHIEALIEARRDEGMSGSSINKEIKMLGRTWRLSRDRWDYSVVPDLVFPTDPYKPKLRWLNEDEQTRLLRELDPKREIRGLATYGKRSELMQRMLQDQYDLVVTLMDTGCRIGEASTLPWSAITLDDMTIALWRWKTDEASTLVMTDRLYEVMRRRYETRQPRDTYVFPAYGTHMGAKADPRKSRGHAIKGITKAITRAELNPPELVERYGKVTPHTLRDTFASMGISDGMSLYQMARLLGHKSLTMTAKYSHLDTRDVSRQATELLNRRHVKRVA